MTQMLEKITAIHNMRLTLFVNKITQCNIGLPKCFIAISSGLSPFETKYSEYKLATSFTLSFIFTRLNKSDTSLYLSVPGCIYCPLGNLSKYIIRILVLLFL